MIYDEAEVKKIEEHIDSILETLSWTNSEFDIEKQETNSYDMENLCKVVKNKESLIEALKNEEIRLKEKRDSVKKALDVVKLIISKKLSDSGEKKQQVGTFTVSFRKSTKTIIDETFKDLRFIKEEIIQNIDTVAVKEALKNGEIIEGAHLEENNNLQIK